MEGDLILSAAPLVDLCRLLGIDTPKLVEVEGADALVHSFTVQGGDAARLDASIVRAFVDHYEDAARVEIRTGDLTEIVLQPGVSDASIGAFAQQAGAGGPYEAIVTVDKARLTRRLVGTTPHRTVRLFLFASSLSRILASGITRFETEVWPHAPEPLTLAVLDADIALEGPHLAVLGGARLADVAASAAVLAPSIDFDVVRDRRDRHIGWDTQWVRSLTPWHFELSGVCAHAELDGLLRAQLVKLAVLFTCDRARARVMPVSPGEIVAEYRGREHVAVVTIDETRPIEASDVEVAAVLRAVDWCYQRHGAGGDPDWVSDRLPFVQTRVAQTLEAHPVDQRLGVFTRTMPYLLEGVEWHWKAFIEARVGDYLEQVQQVETLVGDTVAAFADRTTALAKGLTESILAAVAVLIGSFIAATFETPFNATLFRIGILTYAGYMLIFPGALNGFAAVDAMRSSKAEFEIRVNRLKETLYPEKVDEIIGSRVRNAQSVFFRWFKIVGAAYLAVAIAAIVAAVKAPDLIDDGPAKDPKSESPASPSGA